MRRTALFVSVAAVVMLLASGAMAKDCANEEVKRVEKLDKALGKCGDDADCAEAKRQKCRDKLDKHGCDSSVCDPPSPCEDSIFPECGGECPPDEECGEVSAPFAPQLGLVAGTVCACVAAPPPSECAVDEDCANDTLCDQDACVEGECQHFALGCPIHACLADAFCVPETGDCVEVPFEDCRSAAPGCCPDGEECNADTGVCGVPPECVVDEDCDVDADPCTDTLCEAGECVHPLVGCPLLCPCWNDFNEQGLVDALNAASVIEPECYEEPGYKYARDNDDQNPLILADTLLNACFLDLGAVHTGSVTLLPAEADTCLAELTAIFPQITWCPQ